METGSPPRTLIADSRPLDASGSTMTRRIARAKVRTYWYSDEPAAPPPRPSAQKADDTMVGDVQLELSCSSWEGVKGALGLADGSAPVDLQGVRVAAFVSCSLLPAHVLLLPVMSNLHSLDLSDNCLTSLGETGGADCHFWLAMCSQVEVLRLRGCQLHAVPPLLGAVRLRELDLSCNNISVVDNLEPCSATLAVLNLGFNDFATLLSLRPLALLKSLDSLTVHPNPVTLVSAVEGIFAALRSMLPQVASLDGRPTAPAPGRSRSRTREGDRDISVSGLVGSTVQSRPGSRGSSRSGSRPRGVRTVIERPAEQLGASLVAGDSVPVRDAPTDGVAQTPGVQRSRRFSAEAAAAQRARSLALSTPKLRYLHSSFSPASSSSFSTSAAAAAAAAETSDTQRGDEFHRGRSGSPHYSTAAAASQWNGSVIVRPHLRPKRRSSSVSGRLLVAGITDVPREYLPPPLQASTAVGAAATARGGYVDAVIPFPQRNSISYSDRSESEHEHGGDLKVSPPSPASPTSSGRWSGASFRRLSPTAFSPQQPPDAASATRPTSAPMAALEKAFPRAVSPSTRPATVAFPPRVFASGSAAYSSQPPSKEGVRRGSTRHELTAAAVFSGDAEASNASSRPVSRSVSPAPGHHAPPHSSTRGFSRLHRYLVAGAAPHHSSASRGLSPVTAGTTRRGGDADAGHYSQSCLGDDGIANTASVADHCWLSSRAPAAPTLPPVINDGLTASAAVAAALASARSQVSRGRSGLSRADDGAAFSPGRAAVAPQPEDVAWKHLRRHGSFDGRTRGDYGEASGDIILPGSPVGSDEGAAYEDGDAPPAAVQLLDTWMQAVTLRTLALLSGVNRVLVALYRALMASSSGPASVAGTAMGLILQQPAIDGILTQLARGGLVDPEGLGPLGDPVACIARVASDNGRRLEELAAEAGVQPVLLPARLFTAMVSAERQRAAAVNALRALVAIMRVAQREDGEFRPTGPLLRPGREGGAPLPAARELLQFFFDTLRRSAIASTVLVGPLQEHE